MTQLRQVRYEPAYFPQAECLRLLLLAHSGFGEENHRLALVELEEWASEPGWEQDRFNVRNPREIVQGELALGAGRIEDAIQHLRPALQIERPMCSAYYFLGSLSLARALEQRGDLEAAVAVLEDARQQKGRVYENNYNMGALWMRCLSRLHDLHRAMGNEAAAAELEAELRALLHLADADHPLLVRLTASGSS